MKVYLFYLIDSTISADKYPALDAIATDTNFILDNLITHNSDGYDSMLYAFTPSKSIAKEFKLSRDMSKFITLELNMPKEAYEEFSDTYTYALIENHMLVSSYLDNSGIIRAKNIVMHIPLFESSVVISYIPSIRDDICVIFEEMILTIQDIRHKSIYAYGALNSYLKILNKDIADSLTNLGLKDVFYEYAGMEIGDEDDVAPFSVIGIDTLQIYCMLFSNTYNDMVNFMKVGE